MIVGHFAVGLGAKRWVPSLSLGTAFIAVQWADLLFATLLALGVERVAIEPGLTAASPFDFLRYPFSHSLVAGLVWAALFAAVALLLRRPKAVAVALALLVFSHWLLDWVTHRPDLPLAFGDGPRVGLGLWTSLAGTLAVELPLFALGIWLYLRATRARDGVGTWALWGLVAALLAVYFYGIWGPPPPSPMAVALLGQSIWLFVAWGYWIDRHREVR
jgi:hypothetical protein